MLSRNACREVVASSTMKGKHLCIECFLQVCILHRSTVDSQFFFFNNLPVQMLMQGMSCVGVDARSMQSWCPDSGS